MQTKLGLPPLLVEVVILAFITFIRLVGVEDRFATTERKKGGPLEERPALGPGSGELTRLTDCLPAVPDDRTALPVTMARALAVEPSTTRVLKGRTDVPSSDTKSNWPASSGK